MGEFAKFKIPERKPDEPRKTLMNFNGVAAALKISEYEQNEEEIQKILKAQEECRFCNGKTCPQRIERMVPAIRGYRGFYSVALTSCPFEARAKQESNKTSLLNRSHIPKRYEGKDMTQFKMTESNKKAVMLAEVMSKRSRFGKGLYLHGPKGTGKTLLACIIGNAWLNQNKSVVFTNTQELVAKIRSTVYTNSRVSIKPYKEASLLILDDLGSEKLSNWAAQELCKIIDARYRELLPTIVTSNYSLDNLHTRIARSYSDDEQEEMAGQRLISRLTDMSVPVELAGEDWRTEGTLFA